jgi:putative addiction module component (TIGR02574 family)
MSYSEIVDAVRALPVAEQLALIDELCVMTEGTAEVDEVSAEHRRILDERLAEYQVNPSNVLSWDEMFENPS